MILQFFNLLDDSLLRHLAGARQGSESPGIGSRPHMKFTWPAPRTLTFGRQAVGRLRPSANPWPA